ncbi:MAG: hypothetical protein H6621_10350 [Halobacteriovoraceae bacterium]|nr:hypothetical protein [Halobacteriovoraceae bacterium]MCB9095456.1 hypothetical protein [Halobacteriovoraceae bacterium]
MRPLISIILFLSIKLAWASEGAPQCARLKAQNYYPQNNSIIISLDRDIQTSENKKTRQLTILSTQQKFKVKVSYTRKDSELCFHNVSYQSADRLNKYLSKASGSQVSLYKYPLPEKITIVENNERLFKF